MRIPEPNSTSFYVYLHHRSDNGCVFYVGKGCGNRASSITKRNPYWKNIVSKSHGFFVNMVVKNVDEELAFLVEMECIDQLKKLGVNLCNMTNGGEGASGSKRSQETKNKLSAIRKNLPNSMLGKKHKTESRKKQSDMKKGKYTGIKHPRCSVNIEQVLIIKKLRNTTNMTCKEISLNVGVSYHVVRNIVSKKSWGHTNENT
jgi:hypothetical protein